jgi:aminopeptidase C
MLAILEIEEVMPGILMPFDYPSEFGFDVRFDKSDMLSFWHSAMNHAMVYYGREFQ